MVKNEDLRFAEDTFKSMIGKVFIKYKCDEFTYTNTVTGIVGLYIGEKVYELRNEQESTKYFGSIEDVSIWNIKEINDVDIHSYFDDTEQIETPINEEVNSITLVNEHQSVSINRDEYNLYVTRAIIFHLDSKDVYFEKDNVAFSEEIEIKRGHDLLDDFPKSNDYFMSDWAEGCIPQIETEFVTIK